ncbi:MAG: divalent-cation tolerance protein CutA [Candidatus Bathyarchaeia archaeon]
MEKDYVIVLVTTANREEAEKISKALLEERLIACANIIGPVNSLFWWHEKIEKTEECILLMKSRLDCFDKLSQRVKALHSYEVPEIIALSLVRGSNAYLEWLDKSLGTNP